MNKCKMQFLKLTNIILAFVILAVGFYLSGSGLGKMNAVYAEKSASEDEEDDEIFTGWLTENGKTYYFNSKGNKVKGLKKIGKKYYLFHSKKYYMVKGWKVYKGNKYYFTKKGYAKTGWLTYKKKRFYFSKKGVMAKGWQEIKGHKYFFNKKGHLIKGTFTPDKKYVDVDGKMLQRSTLKKFLETAIQPVGSTMYVWGGGWNKEDTGAGEEAVTIGVSPNWEAFYKKQTASYNYNNTRYQIHDGLDCSGFVGWAVYNAFNTTSGNAGYVMSASDMAKTFAGYGWGTLKPAGSFSDYRAGDILSSSGHVYIVIGQCSDGSVVLVHSTPNGVMINGTCARNGSQNSEAIRLATTYMKKYYPDWYSKYTRIACSYSYLTSYERMRWRLKGKCMMKDPDHYANKNAEEILKDLFN